MSDENVKAHGKHIGAIASALEQSRHTQADHDRRLDSLVERARLLAAELGQSVSFSPPPTPAPEGSVIFAPDLAAAAGILDPSTLKELDRAYLEAIPAIPPMDALDRFVVITVGCLAALADFLLVGLPPNTKWTPGSSQGGLPVGWVSERLKSWTVSDDNWLARLCKAPFDRPTFAGTDAGFSPVNHRALTFAHDPSPIGFVFGLIDIASGGISGVTRDGQPFHFSGPTASWHQLTFSALIWLGHLISDVATPMGLPIPGSSLLQLVRLPMPGAPGDATIADIGRVLYQQGYDLRHYLGSGVVPGLVEGLIRLYFILRHADAGTVNRADPIQARLAERHVAESTSKSRLTALLFWTHAIAAGANAGRVALQAGATGDFFSAARAVNVAEWQLFALQTIKYVMACRRDTDVDQALQNRQKLDAGWDQLTSELGSARILYLVTGNHQPKVVL